MSDERLASTAEALSAELAALRGSVDRQVKALKQTATRNRRAIRWAIAGLLIDLLLTVVGSYVFTRVLNNEQDDDALRAEVLCPLYGEFLASDTPQRRAQLEGEELDRFEHAMVVLGDGAATLGCDTGG